MEKNNKDQNENTEKNPDEKELINESKVSSEEAPVSAETEISDNQVPVDPGEHPQQKAAEEGTESGLPESFTLEPQDQEHIDLRGVKDHEKWTDTYRQVSDDEGHLLGDKELEKTVKELCNELDRINLYRAESPEVLVEKIKELAIQYTKKLNTAENISFGVLTKYRIRQGQILRFQQILVKNRLGKEWIKWFSDNYDKSLLRSAEDYMRIADVQNSVRYSVFGKERLLQIIRRIDKDDLMKEDPIGDFLRENKIDFDPKRETEFKEVRIEADVAVEKEKLVKAGITEISHEFIDTLVRNGRKLTSQNIKQLVLAREKGNLAEKMEKIASGEKIEPLVTPEIKAEGFKKTTNRFMKAIESALTDTEYITDVDMELFNRLKERIQQLEQLLIRE